MIEVPTFYWMFALMILNSETEFCFLLQAGEINLFDTDLSPETKFKPIWSPGALMYYGRAELQASDHRYRNINRSITPLKWQRCCCFCDCHAFLHCCVVKDGSVAHMESSMQNMHKVLGSASSISNSKDHRFKKKLWGNYPGLWRAIARQSRR